MQKVRIRPCKLWRRLRQRFTNLTDRELCDLVRKRDLLQAAAGWQVSDTTERFIHRLRERGLAV